ncbi:MAG: hypothetical protein PHW10_02030 [Candidatus Peribacteraceae bacterium]|nr:hypothetical protein [Candidatus Peribacteraceae bacterium]
MHRAPSRTGASLVLLVLLVGAVTFAAALALSLAYPPDALRAERDGRRMRDVTAILDALRAYEREEGEFPAAVPVGMQREICGQDYPPASCAADNGVNLSLLRDAYLPAIPRDPLIPPTGTGTSYFIGRNAEGQVMITALDGEVAGPIRVVR